MYSWRKIAKTIVLNYPYDYRCKLNILLINLTNILEKGYEQCSRSIFFMKNHIFKIKNIFSRYVEQIIRNNDPMKWLKRTCHKYSKRICI